MEIHVRDLVLLLLAIIQAVGVTAAFRVADALRDIRQGLADLNADVKTGRALHEKLDKENADYHRQCVERLTHIERLHEDRA